MRLSTGWVVGPLLVASTVTAQERYESAGVAVTLQVEGLTSNSLRAGDSARVVVKVSDSRSEVAFAGARPRAWLSSRPSEMVSTETSCRDKIRGFLGGELAVRPDVDLNAAYYLTLNADGTIAFINPLIAWNRTKLEAVVKLPSAGLDWALAADRRRLYVTLPTTRGVALVDTDTHALLRVSDPEASGQPTRVVVSPSDGSVWVGIDDAADVVVYDADLRRLAALDVGRGRHLLALDGNGRTLAVTSTDDNLVTLVDVASRAVLARVAIPGTPLRATWSSRRNAFYVAALNSGTVFRLDEGPWRATPAATLERGTVDLGADLDGRYLFAVNQLRSRVDVIDTSNDRVRAHVGVAAQPDQITFTKRFAYVRSVGTESFSLIDLGPLARGDAGEASQLLSSTDIQAGQLAPASQPEQIGVAPMIVPLPEGNGALVASGPERRLFYYLEGMFAPMGTFDNYRRTPRAVLVLDRGLRESTPGRFETTITAPKAGSYDLAVLTEQPQVAHCFTVRVAPSVGAAGEQQDGPVVVTSQSTTVPGTRELEIVFQVADDNGPVHGVRDARAIVFRPPGTWQTSVWLTEDTSGRYRARVAVPEAGAYSAAFDAPSLGSRAKGRRVVTTDVPAKE